MLNQIPQIISCAKTITPIAGQCDCGYSFTNSFKREDIFSPKSRTPHHTNYRELCLDDDHSVGYNPLHVKPVVLNDPALSLLSLFENPHVLNNLPDSFLKKWGNATIYPFLEQAVRLGLLIPENYSVPSLTTQETLLTSWLHLTDRCNFRCTYCYLPHRRNDMTFATGRKAIDATFRSALNHNYRQVKLKYAGGEPLLQFPMLVELQQYAQTVAEQHELILTGVILSNGSLLTADMLKTIHSLDLHMMISLDGLGKYHDQQRSYSDGQISSEDVVRAVELALEHGIRPDISITVSQQNIAGLPELMEWILQRDLPFSLNFYRTHDRSNDCQDLEFETETIISGLKNVYYVIEANLPRRSLLASLVDRANLAAPHLRTCSAGQSYLVFDPQGRIAQCQMQIEYPVTTAEASDPLAHVRADTSGLQNLSVEDKVECCACQWKYWCAGGCPLTTYRTTGRYDVKSTNCRIYQSLFPEVLRLEGLRLLKYQVYNESC